MTRRAPKGLRLHIGLFGRRNVGKSSLLNALTRQEVSIVSETAGTTTDPVEKPMELLPLGPVLFIDTAGIDDTGALGELRIQKTERIFDRTDLGVIVAEAGRWSEFEEQLLGEMERREIPRIVVMNKCDLGSADGDRMRRLEQSKVPVIRTCVVTGEGIGQVRQALLDHAPEDFVNTPAICSTPTPSAWWSRNVS